MKVACLLALQFVSAASSAMDAVYGSPLSIVARLGRSSGIECCFDGEERRSRFPVLVVNAPLSFAAPGPVAPQDPDTPEFGVTEMQLIIRTPELWRAFEARMNTRARIVCTPHHAFTSHHMTPVNCDVLRIADPKDF